MAFEVFSLRAGALVTGVGRAIRQTRSISSDLDAQVAGSSCLNGSRVRTKVWWNVWTDSGVNAARRLVRWRR